MRTKFVLPLMMACVIISNVAVAQSQTMLGEAYQTGLNIVGQDLSVKLPDKWIFADRERGSLTVAASMNPLSQNGRMLIYMSQNDLDQETNGIYQSLKESGKVVNRGQSDSGGSGNRHLRWWVHESGGKKSFHLAHMRVDVDGENKLDRLVVLRALFPISDDEDTDEFIGENGRAESLQGELKPTIDSFYSNYDDELIGDGLVYNGVLTNGTSKVTLKLPPPYVYAPAYKNDVQLWKSLTNKDRSYVLRNYTGKTLEEFKEVWPGIVTKATQDSGKAQTEGETPGIVDIKLTDFDNDTWKFAYVTTIPTPNGNEVSKLYVEHYVQVGDSIVALIYQQAVKETGTFARNAEITGIMEESKPIFDTFSVKKIN